MKIYTLTLNPAYDVHAFVDEFAPYHENLADVQSREAGGKGVNISRALSANGVKNTAVVVLGKENGEEFKKALLEDGIESIFLEKEGCIRENLTLHCPKAPETRISFSGFRVDDSVLDEITAKLAVDEETIITLTGRVPAGMSMEKVKAFLVGLQKKGAKIVLDSKSFGLEDLYEVKPWLIKPNQEEISEYFGCLIANMGEASAKAEELALHGVENVMISLGEQGALLRSGEKTYIAVPPQIQAVSTIGAGDSTIAGFIAATLQRAEAQECLRTAVAFGTAACMTGGTKPPREKEIVYNYTKIQISLEN